MFVCVCVSSPKVNIFTKLSFLPVQWQRSRWRCNGGHEEKHKVENWCHFSSSHGVSHPFQRDSHKQTTTTARSKTAAVFILNHGRSCKMLQLRFRANEFMPLCNANLTLSVYVFHWLSFPNDSFHFDSFHATTSQTTTTCEKKLENKYKKNLLLIMLIQRQPCVYMRGDEKKNMRTGRSSQRAKMNNYCTGTDFMKWNESFAVILAIIMWRWNAKTLAKNMSTNMYLLYQVS